MTPKPSSGKRPESTVAESASSTTTSFRALYQTPWKEPKIYQMRSLLPSNVGPSSGLTSSEIQEPSVYKKVIIKPVYSLLQAEKSLLPFIFLHKPYIPGLCSSHQIPTSLLGLEAKNWSQPYSEGKTSYCLTATKSSQCGKRESPSGSSLEVSVQLMLFESCKK